jgi:hypothetical protein
MPPPRRLHMLVRPQNREDELYLAGINPGPGLVSKSASLSILDIVRNSAQRFEVI